uniref:SPT6_acidic domain-containing protein n=1 Tax=Anisakis simplex TaxID=6269 RepID=A0A0M3JD38_ANISI
LRREIGLELDYDDVHGGLKRVVPVAQSVNDVSSGKPKKQRSNATTSVSTTTRKYDSLKLDGGEDESDYDYYDTEDEIQAIINRLRRERMKFATEEASGEAPQLAGVRRDLSRLLLRLRRSLA